MDKPAPWMRARSLAFAVADLAFAGLYVLIAHVLDWGADPLFLRGSYLVALIAVVASVGTAAQTPGSRRVAAWSCALLLALGLALVVLLGLSAGYLWGIYGAFGRSAALLTAVLAALALELYALLPFFQLRFLLGEARVGPAVAAKPSTGTLPSP